MCVGNGTSLPTPGNSNCGDELFFKPSILIMGWVWFLPNFKDIS